MASEADIVRRIRKQLAVMLDRPLAEIDPALTFAQLGVDSAAAANLILGLEDWLDIEMDPEIATSQPTMASMATYICMLLSDRPSGRA
jgi:acyl carrier protein